MFCNSGTIIAHLTSLALNLGTFFFLYHFNKNEKGLYDDCTLKKFEFFSSYWKCPRGEAWLLVVTYWLCRR